MTIDQTHHSLSFNEYLTLISINRRAQPSEENLIDAFGYMTYIHIPWLPYILISILAILIRVTLERYPRKCSHKSWRQRKSPKKISRKCWVVTTNIFLKHFYCLCNATCYSLQNRLSDRCWGRGEYKLCWSESHKRRLHHLFYNSRVCEDADQLDRSSVVAL